MANWQDEAKDKLDQGKAKLSEEKGKIEQKASDTKAHGKKRGDGSHKHDNNTALDL